MFNNAMPSVINTVKPHSFTVDLPEGHIEANLDFLDLLTAELSSGKTSPSLVEAHQAKINELVAIIKEKHKLP